MRKKRNTRSTMKISSLLLATTMSSHAFVLPHHNSKLMVPQHNRRALAVSLQANEIMSNALQQQPATKRVLQPSVKLTSDNPDFPELGTDGIYHVLNQASHQALMEAAKDKIVVLKCFAPWCRACKGLEPKFLQITQDDTYRDLPIVWADLSIQHNKEFVKSLGILALPTIQFYVAGQLLDTFACGPSKVPTLKRKLAALVNDHVDTKHRTLKTQPTFPTETSTAEAAEAITSNAQKVVMTPQQQHQLLRDIPYFQDMSIADVDDILEHKAVLKTFAPGTVLTREGQPGQSFFILQDGEVEVCRETIMYADPMTVPASYLGTVVNILSERGDYFGERALITGEPTAASIRALTEVRVWVIEKSDFPASSVLSGQTKGSADMVSRADDKYGVLVGTTLTNKWQEEVVKANQVRGSVNTPQVIRGVDTDDATEVDDDNDLPLSLTQQQTPDNSILNLVHRFQLIRHVSRCFDYIVQTNATWENEGVRKRRSMLVSRLSPAQRGEFMEAFRLIDQDGDGTIALVELKRVMESIGEDKTDAELTELMKNLSASSSNLGREDFMGIMAEAEFYYLFRDIFSALDKNDTGFVKAKDLCRVLEGVRDLISDDRSRTTIIDVEDQEMLIAYEQFSRMLLGSTLA